MCWLHISEKLKYVATVYAPTKESLGTTSLSRNTDDSGRVHNYIA